MRKMLSPLQRYLDASDGAPGMVCRLRVVGRLGDRQIIEELCRDSAMSGVLEVRLDAHRGKECADKILANWSRSGTNQPPLQR